MDNMTTTGQATIFSQPIRQIITMLMACVLVAIGAWLIHDTVSGIVLTSPLLNGFIIAVFLFGVSTCFWQVLILAQSVSWIERFVRHDPDAAEAAAPRLLAPLAGLLRSRDKKMQITSSSSRSILESVATRIDEARDITRYLINLLIFLGLLGTFYGLATTVPAVVETIRGLAPKDGETGIDVFSRLMGGLESQLGGMGTAFSSSLLGLAGSLVVGLLELFAGNGQNRFYRELEEWLSSITRLGVAGSDGDSGENAQAGMMFDHLREQIDFLHSLIAKSDASRAASDENLGKLVAAANELTRIAASEQGQVAILGRIADGQARLIEILSGENSAHRVEAENRMRLRSIDVQLLRILEEISAGRQEAVADLRTDLASLIQVFRQMSRGRT